MRIAFIGTKGMNLGNSVFGGFETVVTELGPRLATHGFEITIYGRKKLYKEKKLPRELNGVRLIFMDSIETKNFGTMTNSFLCIVHAILHHQDIIFLFNLGLGVFIPLINLFGIKVIMHLDGVEWKRGKWGRIAKAMFKAGAFLSTKFADVLIADAFEIQRIYKEKFGRDSVMISYGAEIKNDLSPDFIVEKGLKPNGYYLLVTRFIPENNALFIISSYLKSNLDKPLVVLGNNYYKSTYEDEIRKIKNEQVIFFGQISDREHLYEFYKFSYCYIHGHSVGGTNPTMLEALANSCCILALDTPFNREMLADGEYGQFFTLDENDFVKNLKHLDDSSEVVDSYKQKAINRISNFYNWEFVTDQYLSLLNSFNYPS